MAKQYLSPGWAVVFWIIPILNLILFYFWNKGIKQKWKLDISPGLRTLGLLVPIVNLVMFYFILRDIRAHAGRVKTLKPWFAILIIIPFVILYVAYKIQQALNTLGVETM